MDNHCASCRMIVESLVIPKTIVHNILSDDLKKWKLCARFVPHVLIAEQWEQHIVQAKDLTISCTLLICLPLHFRSWKWSWSGTDVQPYATFRHLYRRNWRLFLLLIFCEQYIGWKNAPTSVSQVMTITLNEKNMFTIFLDFFWWFWKHSLKTYGTHCVVNELCIKIDLKTASLICLF